MDIKVEDIEEESYFSGFCLQNDRQLFSKDFDKKVKNETITSSSDYDIDSKTEIEEKAVVFKFCSQNHSEPFLEDPVTEYNESKKVGIFQTKIEIKEEQWWLEKTSTESQHIDDDIKDGTEGNFSSTNSPSVKKEEDLNYRSTLFSKEALVKGINLKMKKDKSQCENRKCVSPESDVINMGSIKANVCSKEANSGKIACLKQNSFFQQNDINKHNSKRSYGSNLDSDNLSDNSRKEYKCEICDKYCVWLSDLKRHKLIHEDIKPHQCNICDKAFKHLSHLKTHKLIHEGIKPHKCSICDRPFRRLSDLKRHKLIHEGKKPHRCNICEKAFTQLSGLKTHILIHKGIKPHKCNICDKGFVRLSHLKNHILIHKIYIVVPLENPHDS